MSVRKAMKVAAGALRAGLLLVGLGLGLSACASAPTGEVSARWDLTGGEGAYHVSSIEVALPPSAQGQDLERVFAETLHLAATEDNLLTSDRQGAAHAPLFPKAAILFVSVEEVPTPPTYGFRTVTQLYDAQTDALLFSNNYHRNYTRSTKINHANQTGGLGGLLIGGLAAAIKSASDPDNWSHQAVVDYAETLRARFLERNALRAAHADLPISVSDAPPAADDDDAVSAAP
jgi:hypothetical protein